MADLVGTCPKDFFIKWIAEGDAAGDSETGEEYGWYTADSMVLAIKPRDRFYVVAWGRLRGWAPVTRIADAGRGNYVICRRGNAVACTVDFKIPGFRGLKKRWWPREDERPFPDWRTAGVGNATAPSRDASLFDAVKYP